MAPTARMTNIILNVRRLVNAISDDGFTDDQVTRNVNAALYEVADAGYFKKETKIDLPATTTEIDLLDAGNVPDVLEVYGVYWNPDVTTGCGYQCKSYGEFVELKESRLSSISRTNFFTLNNKLYVWPTVTATITDAFIVWHSYNPAEISIGGTPTNPPLPANFDRALEFYAAKLEFMGATDRKLADNKINLFGGEWLKRLAKLSTQGLGDVSYSSGRG